MHHSNKGYSQINTDVPNIFFLLVATSIPVIPFFMQFVMKKKSYHNENFKRSILLFSNLMLLIIALW